MKYMAAVLLLVAAISAQNAPSTDKGRHLDISAIAREANGSVVSIVMSDKKGHPIAQGSGFLISKDGHVVTNYHVIRNGSSAVIKLPDGAFFAVDGVLASDKNRDVAIIKAHGNDFRALTLGDSDRLQVGEEVVAIGSPLSLESTVSNGIVSGVRTDEKEGGKFVQITVPISPGSSGGPLFNMAGKVVGITTSGLIGGENLNFAVPINDAKLLAKSASKLQPLPDESPGVESTASPNVGQPKLIRVWPDHQGLPTFRADCSVVNNVDSCNIFNELAGNTESQIWSGINVYQTSLACFLTPDAVDRPEQVKNFTIFELDTNPRLKNLDSVLDELSTITFYDNGVLSDFAYLFYLVPSPFGEDQFTVMDAGLVTSYEDEPYRGELTKESFSFHRHDHLSHSIDDWNEQYFEISLLTGRYTWVWHHKPHFGRCFSYAGVLTGNWGWGDLTDDQIAKERQQIAAKMQAMVKATKDAQHAQTKKENDCVLNAYRQYCKNCSEERLQRAVIESCMLIGSTDIGGAGKCKQIAAECESK
jgi:S1-C subfamily serine protease